MRVVHLNTSDFGGAAIAAINLHRALLADGVDSELLTLGRTRYDIPHHTRIDPFALGGPRLWNRARFKMRRALEKSGLQDDRDNQPGNTHLKGRPPGLEIFTLPYSWFDVLDHPLVRRADLLHLHWVSYGVIDVERFFSSCTKPVVWTMHDMNPFTGGCHHADGSTGYLESCMHCPQLADPDQAHRWWQAKQRGLHAFPKGQLQLVSPSTWLAQRAKASSLMRDRPTTVIPNGFDTSVFKPMDKREARKALGLPSEARIILFNAFDVASPRKGMPLLIPALKAMEQEPFLLCLGAAPSDLGFSNARFSGHITDPAQVALHYNAADLFVLPSQAENLPNTICESLLCGTPVVAFDVGGISEQVDATNGIVVGQRHSSSLMQAMTQALALTWDRRAMAANALERYDQGLVAKEYHQLYARYVR